MADRGRCQKSCSPESQHASSSRWACRRSANPTSYIIAVALAVGVVLIPGSPLNVVILGVHVLAGIMLPSAIVLLNLPLNDKQVLSGPRAAGFSTSHGTMWSTGTIIIALFVMSGLLAAQVLLLQYFPASAG
jgi:hypothetical protein